MKFLASLFIFGVISSTTSFAQVCPPDVASACFQDYLNSGHSYNRALTDCRDLSNTCYMDARAERLSILESRKICSNVANNCYTDASRVFGSVKAARLCSNVASQCYSDERRWGGRMEAAIRACKDVVNDCRTCH